MSVIESIIIRVDEVRKLIRVALVGKVEENSMRECGKRLRSLPEFQHGFGVILDLSEVTTVPVSSDVIVKLALAARADTNKMAIVAHSPAAFGLARMYEIIVDPQDNRVLVCASEREALHWLRV